jgi:GTP-binding protein
LAPGTAPVPRQLLDRRPEQAVHSTQKRRAGGGRVEAHARRSDRVAPNPFAGAQFLTTAAEWTQLPSGGAAEVAFAGRSNAGKSSAINALANHVRLAYVSKTPGRTQHINFFRLRSGALLADLPGYGYAAVPDSVRRHWGALLSRYLLEREPLVGLVLIMDIRRPMTALDRQMLDWFLPSGRPLRVLLAKADKAGAAEQRDLLQSTRESMEQSYGLHSSQLGLQLFSAAKGAGVEEARVAIAAWLDDAALEKERPRHQGE